MVPNPRPLISAKLCRQPASGHMRCVFFLPKNSWVNVRRLPLTQLDISAYVQGEDPQLLECGVPTCFFRPRPLRRLVVSDL